MEHENEEVEEGSYTLEGLAAAAIVATASVAVIIGVNRVANRVMDEIAIRRRIKKNAKTQNVTD